MADGAAPVPDALAAGLAAGLDGGALVVSVAGSRYALAVGTVDAIAPPPQLCPIPHAPAALLGAGNLGGHVVPVLDLGGLLPGGGPPRVYDGGGEVIRLRAAGGSVGMWVDRVERLATGGAEALTAIDPAPLAAAAMAAPRLAPAAQHPLGDAADIVVQPAAAVAEDAFILVETAGERFQLPREAVLELIEPPPVVRIPGAPAGFDGIGILRGEALPLLSLAALLGLAGRRGCATLAVAVLPDGHRLLLGFDRVIGLRVRRRRTGRRWVDRVSEGSNEDGRAVDLAASIPDELREVIANFARVEIAGRPEDAAQGVAASYLTFAVGGQLCALPATVVDRVVGPQPQIALPRRTEMCDTIDYAIELRGLIVPVVAAGERRGAAVDRAAEPTAYIVLRGADGLIALAAERVERLLPLRPDQITPAPAGQGAIDGIAVLGDGADLLRILAPDRLGGRA